MFLLISSLAAAMVKDVCLFFGYIQNVNSFPQPLNAQEEQLYFEEFKKGNEDAKNILVERNLRLVAHIVKKYTNTGRDVDDLISIGTIGLIKAIITFDGEKGTRLATYAARCIEKGILTLVRHFGSIYPHSSLSPGVCFSGWQPGVEASQWAHIAATLQVHMPRICRGFRPSHIGINGLVCIFIYLMKGHDYAANKI